MFGSPFVIVGGPEQKSRSASAIFKNPPPMFELGPNTAELAECQKLRRPPFSLAGAGICTGTLTTSSGRASI